MKKWLVIFFLTGLIFSPLFAKSFFEFSWNTYATHQPILYEVVKKTTGPIIEFGCGDGSTDMLHSMCRETQRLLVSVDHDETWVNKYTQRYLGDGYKEDNSGWHKFIVIPKQEGNTLLEDWIAFLDQCEILRTVCFDVCLVDQHPGPARTETIMRLKDRAKYIILHDCDMYVSGELGIEIMPIDQKNQIPGIFDFSQTFKNFAVYFPSRPWAGHTGPPTMLGSNFYDDLPEIDFKNYK